MGGTLKAGGDEDELVNHGGQVRWDSELGESRAIDGDMLTLLISFCESGHDAVCMSVVEDGEVEDGEEEDVEILVKASMRIFSAGPGFVRLVMLMFLILSRGGWVAKICLDLQPHCDLFEFQIFL